MFVLLSNLSFDVRAKLAAMASELREDTSGAEIVEYAVMIGLLTAAAIATIILVGNWIAAEWSNLCNNALANSPVKC
jgi:pilus assembly protein Flp/PilA